MTVFIIRRLIQSIIVVFAMTLIVFFGVNIIGNPVDILISPDADQATIDQAIRALGLDRPVHEQYLVFIKNAIKGNLGKSFIFGEPALQLILRRMPATLELAFSAMFIAVVFGIPLGMWAGLKPGAVSSRSIMAGSIIGYSVPTFWLGIMLIMIFSLMLGWLPSVGRGKTVDLLGIPVSFLTWDGIKHLLLPAANLAMFKAALGVRLSRAGTREVVLQDYIKFARAKGLTQKRVIMVHILRNILIPVVTVLGLELGSVIAFAVVTETIFAWPGMGKLIIDSIQVLDRPVIVAYLMITVCLFILINLMVDILCSFLDPRIRLEDIRE